MSRGRRRAWVRTALVVSDATMLVSATFLATELRFNQLIAVANLENVPTPVSFVDISLVLSAIWLLFLYQERLYDFDRLFWGSGEFVRVVRGLSIGLVAFILVTFALKMPGLSRVWTLLAWSLAVTLVCAGRLAIRGGLRVARRRGHLLRPTLIVGSNTEAADIIRVLKSNQATGLVPVGCLASSRADALNLDYCSSDVPSLGPAGDLVDVTREHAIDTVIIASSAFEHEVVARMINELRGINVDTHLSSGLFEVLTSRVLVREVGGVPLITVKGVSLSPWNFFVKRVFDLVVASVMVAVGMPAWVLLMLGIKLGSRGPVFYRQARVGRDGKPFNMLKFRSMCDDADARLAELAEENEASGPLFKMKEDPRVTRIGAFMRKFSLDEFPQLINVLKGEMSLVGPRPPLIPETERYTDHHWRRMEVLPGMTGLWQVSGRSSLTFDEMVRLDLYYIQNWSVAFDMALLMRTIPAVLFAKGAW